MEAVDGDGAPGRRTDWPEQDRALILTGLLAGSCADELRRADVGDIGTSPGGAVIHVRGKAAKDRTVRSRRLLGVICDYLDSRARRCPHNEIVDTARPLTMARERTAVRRPRRRSD